ncbi:MAG: L-fucose/L-arabinose isomerase family protein [Armatimonadota bacterium]
MSTKSTFALYFGNRGFFPASLLASAREEMVSVLKGLGHDVILLDAQATRHGAVETVAEGKVYANFLRENAGKFDGVILSLPNFGDENGAAAALKDARVPILIQAYPDDLDKMAPDLRRDAFCGKLSITDVFYQNGIEFTSLKPHTVAPTSPAFAKQVEYFSAVCQTVKAMRNLTIGSIGARVTPFKTVRIDEIALQKHGITVESFDMSDIFARTKSVSEGSDAFKSRADRFKGYTDFSLVPAESFTNIVKMSVAIDQVIDEYKLDAIAVRCWIEMQQQFGISPCVLLSEMNDRGVTAACEVDIANAVTMYGLSKASGDVSACLDWNNNYGDDEDKCIIFHCGPIPQSMMTGKGLVTTHSILDGSPGICSSFGCNTGRIKPMPITFGSMTTDSGKLRFYLGKGEFTQDPMPEDFFGCGGVVKIPGLQDVLMHAVRYGHKHHVSATPGTVLEPFHEALTRYLHMDVTIPQCK